MKKIIFIFFATLLMVSTLAGCTNVKKTDRQNSSAGQNNAAMQSSDPIISQPATSTTVASGPAVPPEASAAYEKLIAYKTEEYLQKA